MAIAFRKLPSPHSRLRSQVKRFLRLLPRRAPL
jgi:hypothetical protein